MRTKVYHEWLADKELKRDSHNVFEGTVPALTQKHGGNLKTNTSVRISRK
jgi:hypothetical protein